MRPITEPPAKIDPAAASRQELLTWLENEGASRSSLKHRKTHTLRKQCAQYLEDMRRWQQRWRRAMDAHQEPEEAMPQKAAVARNHVADPKCSKPGLGSAKALAKASAPKPTVVSALGEALESARVTLNKLDSIEANLTGAHVDGDDGSGDARGASQPDGFVSLAVEVRDCLYKIARYVESIESELGTT